MSRSKRQWIQLEIQILPGSEPWVLVRHNQKSFKIPAGAAIEALLTGVQHGWQARKQAPAPGGMVTVSRTSYGVLRADADQWNGLTDDQRNELLLSMADPGNKSKGSQRH